MRTYLTLELVVNSFFATAVAENSLRSAPQLVQTSAESFDWALHWEQVCMSRLLDYGYYKTNLV
jgi:hypothetical protein